MFTNCEFCTENNNKTTQNTVNPGDTIRFTGVRNLFTVMRIEDGVPIATDGELEIKVTWDFEIVGLA